MKVLHSSKDCEVAFIKSHCRTIFLSDGSCYLHLPNLLLIKSRANCPCNTSKFFMVAVKEEPKNFVEPINVWLTPFNHSSVGILCVDLDDENIDINLSFKDIIYYLFNSKFNIFNMELFNQWRRGEEWFNTINIKCSEDPLYHDDCNVVMPNFYIDDRYHPPHSSVYVINSEIWHYFGYLKSSGFSIPEKT